MFTPVLQIFQIWTGSDNRMAEVFAFGSLQLLDHFAYGFAATPVEVVPVSTACLSVSGGRIHGIRFAIINLPEPGGLTKKV